MGLPADGGIRANDMTSKIAMRRRNFTFVQLTLYVMLCGLFLVLSAGINPSTDPDIYNGVIVTYAPDRSYLDDLMRYVRVIFLGYTLYNAAYLFKFFQNYRPLLLAFSYAVLSTLWSVNPYATVFSLLNIFLLFSVTSIIVRSNMQYIAISIIWYVSLVILLISLLMALRGSEYAVSSIDMTWRGLFSTKNGFGGFCACFILLTLFLRAQIRTSLLFLLISTILATFGLYKSGSAGAFIALIFSVGAAWVWAVSRKKGVNALLLLGLILSLVLAAILFVTVLPLILNSLGRDLTFTGRTGIWASVLPLTWIRPFGYGYGTQGGIDVAVAISNSLGYEYSSVDNAYLVLALDLGWLFVLFYTCMLVFIILRPPSASFRAKGLSYEPFAFFMLAIGIVEKSGGPYASYSFFILVFLYLKEASGFTGAFGGHSVLRYRSKFR